MNFKVYDILSQLVPGFLVYLLILNVQGKAYDYIPIVPATAVAFMIGYFINAFSSWIEEVYYWSWGGKPSTMLLKGRKIWKVDFHSKDKARTLLIKDSNKENSTENELFEIAMRSAHQAGNERVHDFNASFAFSRVILTTTIFIGIILLIKHYNLFWVWLFVIGLIITAWIRCQQRGGYYAREVLNTYIRIKDQNK